MKMRKYMGCAVVLLGLLQGCYTTTTEVKPVEYTSWQSEFQAKLPFLGHRNWVLIVDKAFPLQSASGITVMNSNEALLPVLTYVLGGIEGCTHVKPIIYQDKELSYITEAQSKGVVALRDALKKAFRQRTVQQIVHDSVFLKIDEASKLFNVLVIKTNEIIPYSSVFINLDCAYWNAEKEAALRQNMLMGTSKNP
jgi:hypothetical protein